jgi:hypothetical protein
MRTFTEAISGSIIRLKGSYFVGPLRKRYLYHWTGKAALAKGANMVPPPSEDAIRSIF